MSKEKHIYINAGIKLLSKSEVLRYISDKTYNKIKAKDTSPMFIMCSIGYEGESKGPLFKKSVKGDKLDNWYKQLWPLRAVKQLIRFMKNEKYLPVYEAHEPTSNSRDVVGNIIASTKKVIGGVAHAVGIAYINNYGTRERIKDGEYDACSLEANCLFERSDNLYRYIVRDVKELLGIALCNSEVNPPGFDDSKILAVVTAMARDDDDEDDDDEYVGRKRKSRKRQSKGADMTLKEAQDYIREHGVVPSTVFTVQELTEDSKVKDAFDNELKTKTDELQKKNDELEKELEPLRAGAADAKVTDFIRGSALLKNEYKEVVDYLTDTLKVKLDEKEAKPQDVVDAAIKSQLEKMSKANFKTKTAEAGDEEAGKDEDKDESGEEGKEKDEAGKSKKTGGKDFTSAEDNDLIP